ncbi:beta-ketoacyl-[acyl-carrier-protein] synthase family protein [Agriterribacter sp.]|uniref:beta-ketoacyl-[acyl-carrier-protein] synthase family protein n=1 Tax=Agriterribacter sp. TaxID=2821509 RepID=UPI002CFB5009|nr:beta-ketoacyl-[acyl-carrier-protein] synthase family protein [Agriterribacter sp.]HRO44233.1 beta-ketoacyl-[acyl-carrier-protein] synthase family protein [Agriterribacter sp.]HRQ18854.1 beta-ketoacyl-[acyl-carrier-protein] synthase family protein [Agriterribacter sp.]
MSSPVFIAGAGVISAIGHTIAGNLAALESETAGISEMRYLHSAHRRKLPVAEVKMSNEELAVMAGMPAHISRTALLSAIAAKEALRHAAIENFNELRTGFISANTVGGMDKTEDFFPDFLSHPYKGRLRNIVHHECGAATELVADQLGIKNYISTISTACSSSANAIFFGARLIRQNMLDVVIAGGTDALTRFTLNGFNTLMIVDQQHCQPFDENRRGLNLGEGAGYVVLVSEKVAATLSHHPVCTLSGYCNANDAYHQTASSPDGAGSYLAMKGALEQSGLQPGEIDYINLHGTGTQNNDIAEGTAIKMLFEGHYPPMSSTKSFTGHTLGASGGIEAVFSMLAIQHGLIYPNLRLETPMKDLPFVPEKHFKKGVPVRHVLSNSFGFGGNCSSLIFSKV